MSKFDTEKDGRLVELYQDHREKLECIATTFHQNKTRRSGWESIAKANNENKTNFTWEKCKKKVAKYKIYSKSPKRCK